MKMPSRTTVIRGGITVAVLVAAIVAGSLFAGSRRAPVPATIQLSAAQKSQADYDKALSALSNEDTATAIQLLERAVAADAANTAAKERLDALKKSPESAASSAATSTPAGSTTPSAPAVPAGPDPFLAKIDVSKLLPATADGFWFGSVQVIAPDATRAGGSTEPDSKSQSVVWTVHDRGSADAAQAFVDNVSKGLYSRDAATTNVRGTTAFFGTDGTRFATVAFRRGRYAFEVVVTTSVPPVEMKALAEQAAAAFPVKP